MEKGKFRLLKLIDVLYAQEALCILVFLLFIHPLWQGCGSQAVEPLPTKDSSDVKRQARETAAGVETATEEEWEDVDFRKEYLDSYSETFTVDTTVMLGGNARRILLQHLCAFDSALVIPARYNWDTKKDFITHNFYTELVLLSGTDTVFRKIIDKSVFESLMQPEWKPYANLSDPNIHFTKDSLLLQYSVSIPVTDLGEQISIRFDERGNYQVFK